MTTQMLIDRIPGLAALQSETLGDRRISVAILDGTVDLSHDCLRAADIEAVETLVSPALSGHASPHGTHVASILFGQPGTLVPGISPLCKGFVVPVFSDGADGHRAAGTQLDLARAITRAVSLGAHVINLSGGQLAASAEAEWALADALRLCAESEVLIVAAAGNDGCECLHVPAASPSVLVVGAMDDSGNPSTFSNWNDAYQGHGILAPGEAIPVAAPGGGVVTKTGTSYAAPIVSGVLALLMSRELLHGRRLYPREVLASLLNSATHCDVQPIADCRRLLNGRLNIIDAQRYLDKKGQTPVTEQTHDIRDQSGSSDSIDMPTTSRTHGAVNTPARVTPSDCGCGGGGGAPLEKVENKPALGYVLGSLGFDFGSEARRDSLSQHAGRPLHGAPSLLEYLNENPWDASSIIWTLNIDDTPIYAVRPHGPFAAETFRRLQEFLGDSNVERVSIPGVVQGSTTLLNGQKVPNIFPEVRGMASWSTAALVRGAQAAVTAGSGEDVAKFQSVGKSAEHLTNFLERVYHELRNLGLSSQDRAINFAATNAFQAQSVFADASNKNLNLQSIAVEKSPISRASSDCWDVKLVFFDPKHKTEVAQKVYRFTVDVSDVVPVTVGKTRAWNTY